MSESSSQDTPLPKKDTADSIESGDSTESAYTRESQEEQEQPGAVSSVDNDEPPADSATEGTQHDDEQDPLLMLDKARAEASENYDRYLRAVAELDNYRKRTVRMRAESREDTLRDVLVQIAPFLDNMRRALAQETDEAASLKQGFELILTQFRGILNGYGLEEIETAGQEFDPNLHEAMLEVESSDHNPGTVIEETEKGYKLNDRVVRPARVVVSKAPGAASAAVGPKTADPGDGESRECDSAESDANGE